MQHVAEVQGAEATESPDGGVYVNTSKQVGDKDHHTFLETLEMNAV